jgi:beta-galactosidase
LPPPRSILAALLAAALSSAALPLHAQPAPKNLIAVDASATISAPETGYLHMGGTSPTGHSIRVNSRYLVLDGKPWLPVMGEIHYSRVPETEWESEILKMKAGGINIISTYVFWIHHEEVEGTFDWSGRRDLRHFVELCAKHGMYVYLRPGPWAHGEVRNGGFPDWLVKLPHTRSNDPDYLAHVATFYNQIGKQVAGLMYQQGGPILGTQLENEYGQHGPGKGNEHISKLKELAIAAGINPPLFSVTGWPSLDFPPHEVLPVTGGYPDGFWYTSKSNLPPSITYDFNFHRELGDMGANLKTENADGKVDLRHDPYFAAEEAGGMAIAYHRRPLMQADDIAAVTLTGIGSGVNLYGYYMFHGGANPTGKLSTLQESRATHYPNDLTQIDYDFQAPIGEFGQVRESYRKTRLIHLFLNAYGPLLAPMPAFAPAVVPATPADNSVPRIAVRSDGNSGFLFVNNYVRQLNMPARPQFQTSLKLPGGEMLVPQHPIDIPANAYFILPFNLAIGTAKLQTATAQLLTRVDTPKGPLTVFFALPGVAPEFVFDAATVTKVTLNNTRGTVNRRGGSFVVEGITPSLNATIECTDSTGVRSTILLLSQAQAEHAAMIRLNDRDYLTLSGSDLFLDGNKLHLLSTASAKQEFAVLPALAAADTVASAAAAKPVAEPLGLWTTYTFSQPDRLLPMTATPTRKAAPRAAMKMAEIAPGKRGPAFPLLPDDAAFATSAEWQIKVDPIDMHGLAEVLLQIDYVGDIGHLSSAGTLLDDNFYNGAIWQVGLKRFGPTALATPLDLKIMPLPANAPIYLDERARAALKAHEPNPQLLKATLIPQYESIVTLTPAP